MMLCFCIFVGSNKHFQFHSISTACCLFVDDTELPAIWSPMAKTDHVTLVTLQPTSDEYRRVNNMLISSAGGTVKRVISVRITYHTVVMHISTYTVHCK